MTGQKLFSLPHLLLLLLLLLPFTCVLIRWFGILALSKVDQRRSDRGATGLRPVLEERDGKVVKRSFCNVFAHRSKESVVMKDIVSVFRLTL